MAPRIKSEFRFGFDGNLSYIYASGFSNSIIWQFIVNHRFV